MSEPQRHRATVAAARAQVPGPPAPGWPDGTPFATLLAHGTMTVEYYAPVGTDLQQPHDQDELYFIERGSGVFALEDEELPFAPGDCLFVPAGARHRFKSFTAGFGAWAVFFGPPGGERP
jgi:mannose-6-phosphate isomerase-like protein (cupin superfamily)